MDSFTTLLECVVLLAGLASEPQTPRADSTAALHGPTLVPPTLCPPPASTDTLGWWPFGLDEAMRHGPWWVTSQGRGLASTALGAHLPVPPSLLWHGLPLEWPLELGGDLGVASATGGGRLLSSPLPPWLGVGGGTVVVLPWQDMGGVPTTSVHVVRGSKNERSYALALGTGITSSLSTVFTLDLSKGDGARTNADYTRGHYGVRLDLRSRLLGPCRVVASRGTVKRGYPGPDPRLWATVDDPLSPGFWAITAGHGAPDAMWASDRESLGVRLFSLQLQPALRGIPTTLAVVDEGLDGHRQRRVPILGPPPHVRSADGDFASHRRAVWTRAVLVKAEEESLWAGLSVDRAVREARIGWEEGDSTWTGDTTRETSRVRVGLGGGLGGSFASVTVTSTSSGTALSWGCTAHRTHAGLTVEAGAAATAGEAKLEDLWRGLLWGDEVPTDAGTVGAAWATLRRWSPLGQLALGGVVGWGRRAWGWCEADTLPPGSLRRWGPRSIRARGIVASWETSPWRGVTAYASVEGVPWEVDGVLLPGRPAVVGRVRVGYERPLGPATPKAELLVRYVGQRYAGLHEALPLDPFWQIDAHVGITIGDLTLRLRLENLTDARYEDERGCPGEGFSLRAGFTWLFWD